MRNILADVGSGKRQESNADAQIFWIFEHQQPCRYREKIWIYKIKNAHFVCVCLYVLSCWKWLSYQFHFESTKLGKVFCRWLQVFRLVFQFSWTSWFHERLNTEFESLKTYRTFKQNRLMNRWPTNENIIEIHKYPTKGRMT